MRAQIPTTTACRAFAHSNWISFHLILVENLFQYVENYTDVVL